MAFDFKGKKYWDEMSGTAEVTSASGRLENRRGLLIQARLSEAERRSNHLPEGEAYSVFSCEEGQRHIIPLARFKADDQQGVATSTIVGKPLRGLRDQCDDLANERGVHMGDAPNQLLCSDPVGGWARVIGTDPWDKLPGVVTSGTPSAHPAR